MARRRGNQAGARGVLCRNLAMDRPARDRPAAGARALSQRRRAGLLLSEACLGRHQRAYRSRQGSRGR